MDLSVITLVGSHSLAFVSLVLFKCYIFYASFTLKLNREFYCDKLVIENCALLVITERVGVIPFRRFRKIYWSHLQW